MSTNPIDLGAFDDLLPTDTEVATYRERGWYISRRIIPDEVLDAAIEGSERYYRGEMDDGPPIPPECMPSVPPPAGLRKNDYSSLRRHELDAVVRVPALGAIAARLSGAEGIRLWHDQLLYKPPAAPDAATNVGWHTDRSYWGACSSNQMLTAWVPFHDVTEAHGPVMMLDGSNHWRDDERDDRRFFQQDLDELENDIARPGRTLVKVPMILDRGHVSFHNWRTFHGSGANRTVEPRRSIAVHMQPADNRFSGRAEADGSPVFHQNNTICRWTDGGPDYTDPRYFPVLWPVPVEAPATMKA